MFACGVCFAGLLKASFPPGMWWVWIGSFWFLSLSIVGWNLRGVGRLIPGPGLALLILFLVALSVPWTGPYFAMFLLPFCVLSTILALFAVRSEPRRTKRTVLGLTVAAVMALTASAVFVYARVVRMTPTERVQRVEGTPGVEIEVNRIAHGPNARSDYEEILSSTDDAWIAHAIGLRLECSPNDLACAAMLIDVLDRERSVYGADETEAKLRHISGVSLPRDSSGDDWREALRGLTDAGELHR